MENIRMAVRSFLGGLCVPFLMLTGYRFDKSFRWGTTKMKALIYRWVDVVRANQWAGM